MSYYNRHIFFCVNDRGCDAERPSCAQCGGQEMRDYAKAKIKGMGLSGEGNIRVNQAGCLDRCEEGPACVVYPEGTWYTFIDESDVDEIVESHLVNGKIVDRLLI